MSDTPGPGKFPRADAVLARVKHPPSRVLRVQAFAFGATVLSRASDEWTRGRLPLALAKRHKIAGKDSEADVRPAYEAVIAALRTQKDVSAFNMRGTGDNLLSTLTHVGHIVQGPIFEAKLRLPIELQKYGKTPFAADTPVEEFEVYCGGSCWVAAWDLPDYVFSGMIGQEFRELLRTAIGTQAGWFTPSIGPTPLGRDVYAIIVDDLPGDSRSVLSIYSDGEDVVLVVPQRFLTVGPIGVVLLGECGLTLLSFYHASVMKDLVGLYRQQAEGMLGVAARAIGRAQAGAWYDVVRRHGHIRRARRTLVRLQGVLGRFDKHRAEYLRSATQAMKEVKENKIMSAMSPYTKSALRDAEQLPASFVASMQVLGSEVQSLDIASVTVVAAVLGGLIGSLVAAILGGFVGCAG